MIPRRTFLASSSAFSVATALAGWRNGPEVPRARVGLLTDTHITDNPDSCRLVGEAFRLFRREKVDTVLHAGDLADVWSPAGYREYRRLFHSVFGGRSPRELFSFGQHDAVRFPSPLKAGEKWYDVVWPAFTRAMETDQPYQLTTTLGGFPLVVFPQKWVEREYDQLLELVDKAVREHPDGPVFVLRHMPIIGTTVRSDAFDTALGDVQRMSRYPNVIMLTGHAHEDLHDARALWQEGFTAVGLGTLQWPRLQNVGRPVGIYVQNVTMTMELYSDRAEFVRWNLATGESVGERWIVHWGLHPEILGMRTRRARERLGRFPDGARATAVPEKDGGCTVRFPEILDNSSVHRYEVCAEVGGRVVAVVGVRGPWYAEIQDRKAPEAPFAAGIFRPGENVSFRIVPMTFWDRTGPALTCSWRVPSPSPLTTETWSGRPAVERATRYPFGFLFNIPDAAWAGAKGSHFRIRVGLAADANGTLCVYSRKRRQTVGQTGIGALYCAGGTDDHPLRYVLDIVKGDADETYSVYFTQTVARKAALAAAVVERVG